MNETKLTAGVIRDHPGFVEFDKFPKFKDMLILQDQKTTWTETAKQWTHEGKPCIHVHMETSRRDLVKGFLFDDPKHKLEIILKYS